MKQETFSDFEAFRATNPQLDGEWLLNGGSEWRWSSDSLSVGACGMLRCYSHTGLIIEGVGSADGCGFYVPFKDGVWRNNGVGFNADEVIILEPGAEHCETSKRGDGWHCVFFPKLLLARQSEWNRDPRRYSYSVKDRARADEVRTMFQRVIAAAAENPAIETSPAARMIEAELRSLLVPLLGLDHDSCADNGASKGRPRFSRSEIVGKTQSILEERDREAIHVSELAAEVGVSERSLRKVFNEYYQIAPRQYLQLRQLHRARRDLMAAGPESTTVADVLVRWGVWDFGRFAGRYKARFGELPKETLRAKPRSSEAEAVSPHFTGRTR